MDLEFLSLDKFKFDFLFNTVSYFLPLFRSSNAIQIWKMKFYFKVEIGIKVIWFRIDLSSEENNIIYLNFFLTVPNQKCFGTKSLIVIVYLAQH